MVRERVVSWFLGLLAFAVLAGLASRIAPPLPVAYAGFELPGTATELTFAENIGINGAGQRLKTIRVVIEGCAWYAFWCSPTIKTAYPIP